MQSDGSIRPPEPLRPGGGAGSGAIKMESCAVPALLFSFRRGPQIALKNYTGYFANLNASLSAPHMASQLKVVATEVCGPLYARLAPNFIRLRLSMRDFLLIVSSNGAFLLASSWEFVLILRKKRDLEPLVSF